KCLVEGVSGRVGGLGEHGARAGQQPGRQLDDADEEVRGARDDNRAAGGPPLRCGGRFPALAFRAAPADRGAGAAFDLGDVPVLHVDALARYQRYQRRLGPPEAAPVKKKPSSHRTSTIRAIHHSTCTAKPSPPRMRASRRTARMTAIVVSFPDMDDP